MSPIDDVACYSLNRLYCLKRISFGEPVIGMEENDLDRAEALFDEFDLEHLTPAIWLSELQRLAEQGESPTVLRLLEKSLHARWLEELGERLAAQSVTQREAELRHWFTVGALSAAEADHLKLALNAQASQESLFYPGLVVDKYVLGEPLYAPKEGLSLIYLARQGNLDRVIKFIHPQRLATDHAEATAQFDQELKHLHVLDGIQGIVSTIDWGVYEPSEGIALPYLVTPYLRDAVAITHYARHNELNLDARLKLFARVCEAVRAAHRKGIVHRDLKPANILVDQAGQVWLIDFGLALAWGPWLEDATWSPSPGSRQYMSPEHVAPDYGTVGFHSDVYALGLILYELLSETPAYHVTSSKVILETIPRPISEHNPQFRGTDLEQQLDRALAKSPQERCSLHELQAAVSAYRTRPAIRLHPRFLIIATAIILVLLLLGGGGLISRSPIVLSGTWQAEVSYPWGLKCLEHFHFEQQGDTLKGTASFVGVPRALFDGHIEADRVQFVIYTHNIGPTGLSDKTSRHYGGRIMEDRIDFVMSTDSNHSVNAVTRFSAQSDLQDTTSADRRCVSVSG